MGLLSGTKVIELGGIGPGPFTGMMLSDFGAEVIRIDRTQDTAADPPPDPLRRGRRSVALDLKRPEGRDVLLRLLDLADVLIDPFRPGVTERLGIGPDVVHQRNARIVYARVTGWGQDGPLAHVAAHDLNYLALAGPLAAIGRRSEPPPPPLNLVGDFGGGGMLAAFGIAAALFERERSGLGQIIDVAMLDGIAALFASIVGFANSGDWIPTRESNFADGGAHWANAYETADGGYVTVATLEPQFYALLLERLGLDPAEWPQHERTLWPELRARFADIFRTRTRDEWCELLEGTDACFAPVLTLEEATGHPHIASRGTYVERNGMLQQSPAPRFSRTPGEIGAAPAPAGSHSFEVLQESGWSTAEIKQLIDSGVVAEARVIASATQPSGTE
jgi:alpha-methylacyl-CoA racemase